MKAAITLFFNLFWNPKLAITSLVWSGKHTELLGFKRQIYLLYSTNYLLKNYNYSLKAFMYRLLAIIFEVDDFLDERSGFIENDGTIVDYLYKIKRFNKLINQFFESSPLDESGKIRLNASFNEFVMSAQLIKNAKIQTPNDYLRYGHISIGAACVITIVLLSEYLIPQYRNILSMTF